MVTKERVSSLIDPDPINGHVLNHMFGSTVDQMEIINKLVVNGRNLTGMDAKIYLRESYLEDYGIAILDETLNPECSPLALVAMNPKEDLPTLGPMYRRMHQYRLFKVYDHYKLTLLEFMDLPRAVIEYMVEELGELAASTHPTPPT